MRTFSEREGLDWLKEAGLSPKGAREYSIDAFKRIYAVKADSGFKSSLARELAHVCHYPALLWIDSPSVWPSAGNLPLFRLARSAVGENRDLESAPAHLFWPNDSDVLEAFLGMTLYFIWEAILYEQPNGRVWLFSHDELCAFEASGRHEREATDLLRRSGMVPLYREK